MAALGGRVYVLGGFDARQAPVATVEAFDVRAGSWTRVAPLPQPLHHVNVAEVGGRLFVVGALAGNFHAVGVVYAYDSSTDRWTEKRSMRSGTERGASGVAAIGAKIYVAGGFRGGSVANFSAYDTASDSWEELPELPGRRDHLAAAAVGGAFYAISGRENGQLRGRVDRYDPVSRAWTDRAPLPTPRGGIAAAAVRDHIFVFGGEGNRGTATGVFLENEEYDPAADRWTQREPMPTPRHGIGAAAVDATIFVPGGATQEGFGASAANEAFTP